MSAMIDPIDEVITTMYEAHAGNSKEGDSAELQDARQHIWMLVGIIMGLRTQLQKAKD